ncbi:hypothetical protein DVV81_13120 [Clostridium botulinum]|uniref:hypothetical protein n=1 Tax=Clostridium botulinum TaxID=1491 RepID=UPI001966FEAD|nr:hypothetical protein [Clostridium botulinum]MBN1072099.1 hypothetical protein [Clostridium botulinum]
MIKIPKHKYIDKNKKLNIPQEHFNYIKGYLFNLINLYINCCDIVKNEKISITKNVDNLNMNIINGCLAVITNKTYKELGKFKSKEDILKGSINNEFKYNINKIKEILVELIDDESEIYIEKIIKYKPKELINIYNIFIQKCKNIKEKSVNIVSKENIIEESVFKNILNKIFNYDKFIDSGFNIDNTTKTSYRRWSAYEYCEKLNVNVCPYCNRIYTYTVIQKYCEKENITRPELDHYFPKSKYPIFALSFFNLIPSCNICNSTIKGINELNINKNLHPYLDELDDGYKFDYDVKGISTFEGDKSSIKIKIYKGKLDDKSNNTLKFFKIEQIYQKHTDTVANLILLRRKYTDGVLQEITDLINNNGNGLLSKEELFNDLFHEFNENEIVDTSLGKLKKDITNKLRINNK